jgi:hypothetical protein
MTAAPALRRTYLVFGRRIHHPLKLTCFAVALPNSTIPLQFLALVALAK